MSEAKLIFKAELIDGKVKATLCNGHTALLSLALQVTDLAVKEQIMIQDEIKTTEDAPKILTKEPEIVMPDLLIGKL